MLTGQRREEGALSWAEVDLDKRELLLPAERTKNHRPHVVPLSDDALALLSEHLEGRRRVFVFGRLDTGFSEWSKAKAELDARIAKARAQAARKAEAKAVPEWVLHDLRRSNRLGVVDVPCPHCSPHRRPTNRRKRVLRIWRELADVLTYCCIHCGAHGLAHDRHTRLIDRTEVARRMREAHRRHVEHVQERRR